MKDNIMLSYLMQQVDEGELRWINACEVSDKWSKKLDTWTHVALMLSAQFERATSLSDIGQLAAWVDQGIDKSALSRVNTRDDRADIFAMLFRKLTHKAKGKKIPSGVKETIDIIDTSYMLVPTVQFGDWRYDDTRGAVKIGLVMNLNREIPTELVITDGKVGDTKFLAQLKLKTNVLYLFDAGFRWYEQFDALIENDIDFITRIQSNSYADVIEDHLLPPRNNGIYADQVVRLGRDRPERMCHTLRLIRLIGHDGKDVWLVTTRDDVRAEQIVTLYKKRWEIEVFFKTIKQHLKIKRFYGTSESAVRIQLYAALIAYLIVWMLKKQNTSMLEAFRFVKYTLFQRFTDVESQVNLANNSPPINLCND